MLQHRPHTTVDIRDKLRRLHIGTSRHTSPDRGPDAPTDGVGKRPLAENTLRGPLDRAARCPFDVARGRKILERVGSVLGRLRQTTRNSIGNCVHWPALTHQRNVSGPGNLWICRIDGVSDRPFAPTRRLLETGQLWARNYSEEAAILETLRQWMRPSHILVTFNGKSFDWPLIRDRWVVHHFSRQKTLPDVPHCDLLHHARRRWKDDLPNCKLQTLERFFCGRFRSGDIPGREYPRRITTTFGRTIPNWSATSYIIMRWIL